MATRFFFAIHLWFYQDWCSLVSDLEYAFFQCVGSKVNDLQFSFVPVPYHFVLVMHLSVQPMRFLAPRWPNLNQSRLVVNCWKWEKIEFERLVLVSVSLYIWKNPWRWSPLGSTAVCVCVCRVRRIEVHIVRLSNR